MIQIENIPYGHENAVQRPANPIEDRVLRAHIEKANRNNDCIINVGNTWLQICRVKDSVLVTDTKLISNALYITDSGKMFITDFSGNRIDIVK